MGSGPGAKPNAGAGYGGAPPGADAQ
jgi:hypothetical protein